MDNFIVGFYRTSERSEENFSEANQKILNRFQILTDFSEFRKLFWYT